MTTEFEPALCWHQFQMPKHGFRPEQSDDVVAGDPQSGRFAVVDGAAESLCAGFWARLLAERFVSQPVVLSAPTDWADWLKPIRQQWWREVVPMTLPWYSEQKLSDGAGATFIGLCVRADQSWHALAVGDACLFLLRDRKLEVAFPMSDPAEFNNRPGQILSRGLVVEPPPKELHGKWQSDDRFLLMSDATAHWFLSQITQHQEPWLVVDRLLNKSIPLAERFDEVERLRDSGAWRNDDVSIVGIDV